MAPHPDASRDLGGPGSPVPRRRRLSVPGSGLGVGPEDPLAHWVGRPPPPPPPPQQRAVSRPAPQDHASAGSGQSLDGLRGGAHPFHLLRPIRAHRPRMPRLHPRPRCCPVPRREPPNPRSAFAGSLRPGALLGRMRAGSPGRRETGKHRPYARASTPIRQVSTGLLLLVPGDWRVEVTRCYLDGRITQSPSFSPLFPYQPLSPRGLRPPFSRWAPGARRSESVIPGRR